MPMIGNKSRIVLKESQFCNIFVGGEYAIVLIDGEFCIVIFADEFWFVLNGDKFGIEIKTMNN